MDGWMDGCKGEWVVGCRQFWKNLLPPALDFSEMSLIPTCQNTWHHIPYNNTLDIYFYENLKSNNIIIISYKINKK